MKFDQLNLHDNLFKGITAAGFVRCTPVQEQSLPESLLGKDIIVQSQTGTGKTAVFLLSIINKLIKENKKAGKPRALIVVPTRELAMQIDHDAKILGKYLPFRYLAVYGGIGYEKQKSELSKGIDIIAATPGRLIDLYKSKYLSLASISQFVIDEADRMFDMGFIPDIRYIANQLPKSISRQTMLFSATIDDKVIRLASRYMKSNPALIEVDPEQVTVDLIDQKIMYVSNEEKLSVLMALLKRPEFEKVIIFTNMKRTAELLDFKLKGNGFPVHVITGDVNQLKRQQIIDRIKSGKVKFLVATEVAARGLHIENITHVINYDLPNEAANYVHRIGRTARAGKTGQAYSLVCEDHVLNLPKIEEFIECKINKEWIDESELVEDKAGPFRKKRKPGWKEEKDLKRKKTVEKEKSFSSSQNRKNKLKTQKRVGKEQNPTLQKKQRPLPSSPEDRITYYKKKYGEDFSSGRKASNSTAKEPSKTKTGKSHLLSKNKSTKKKGGMLKKVLSVFGK